MNAKSYSSGISVNLITYYLYEPFWRVVLERLDLCRFSGGLQESNCRCVQDSLERCQCGSWKTGQHGVAIVQTPQDRCCN